MPMIAGFDAEIDVFRDQRYARTRVFLLAARACVPKIALFRIRDRASCGAVRR